MSLLANNNRTAQSGSTSGDMHSKDTSQAAKTVSGSRRIVHNELPVFSRKLSAMLSSGLGIANVLSSLEKQASGASFKSVIHHLRTEVETGKPVSTAMSQYPAIFDDLYVNMVAAGEFGGRLAETFARLATFLEANARMRRKIKSAMMYPTIILTIAAAICSGMLAFVIPVFSEMFEGTSESLPAPTQMLVDMSNALRNNSLEIVALLTIIILLFKYWKATPSGLYSCSRITLHIPVIGQLNRKITASRFAHTYSELLASGVNILSALEISAGATGNLVTARAINECRSDVERGELLSTALSRKGVFPVELIEMLEAGEKSGKIDEMLENIAGFYDDEVESAIAGLTSLINPILMVILGIIIGGMVIAMYLPIFKLPGIF